MNKEIIDFNFCSENERDYGGNAGEKLGIVYQNENWILKFPKSTKGFDKINISYTTAPLSEYLGSHIYELLGIPVHETLLGEKDNKIVVACKDFLKNGEELKEFKNLKNMYSKDLTDLLASEGSSGSGDGTDLNVVLAVIEKNKILKKLPEAETRFWDMFVVDAFINNNDRNNGNWGVITHTDNSKELAPVFDNGNAFNNKLDIMKMGRMMSNIESMRQSCLSTICVYELDGKRINPNQFILSAENEKCNAAVKRIQKRIDLEKINKFIDEIPEQYHDLPVMDKVYKEFIKESLKMRKEYVLDKAVEIITAKKMNQVGIKDRMKKAQTQIANKNVPSRNINNGRDR